MKQLKLKKTIFYFSFLFFLVFGYSCKKQNVECLTSTGCKNKLVDAYELSRRGELDSSILISHQAVLLGKNKFCMKCEGGAFLELGTAHWYKENLDSARYYYKAAAALSAGVSLLSELNYKATSNQALVYASEGRYQEGANVYESLEIPENKKERARYFLNLGEMYRLQRQYKRAYELLQQASDIYGELRDTINLVRSYTNLSIVDQALERHEEMLALNSKALRIIKPRNDAPILKAAVLNNYGQALMNLNKPKEAIPLFEESYEITKGLKRYRSANEKKANIAFCHYKLNQLDTALQIINEVIEEQFAEKDSVNLVESNLMKGKIMAQLGNKKVAVQIFKKAQSYNIHGDMNRTIRLYSNLAETLASLGDFDTAYENMKLFQMGKDSILGLEVKQKVEELDALYDKHRADVEILNANIENERLANQRNIVAIISTFLFIGFLGLVLWFINVKKQNRKLKGKNDVIHKMNNDLKVKNEVINAMYEDTLDKANSYAYENKLLSIEKTTLKNKLSDKSKIDELSLEYRSGAFTDLRNVLYIEGQRNSSIIHTENNVLNSSKPLSQLQTVLPDKFFIRIHKSFIVNKVKVSEIGKEKLRLENGTYLNIGRAYKEASEYYRQIQLVFCPSVSVVRP